MVSRVQKILRRYRVPPAGGRGSWAAEPPSSFST